MAINKLKSSILDQIKKNHRLIVALADLHERHYWTIYRWLNDNDPLLTTIDSLHLICSYLEVDQDQILES
jgi:hypothetical protein